MSSIAKPSYEESSLFVIAAFLLSLMCYWYCTDYAYYSHNQMDSETGYDVYQFNSIQGNTKIAEFLRKFKEEGFQIKWVLIGGMVYAGLGKLPSHIEARYLVPFYWVGSFFVGYVLWLVTQLYSRKKRRKNFS